MSSDFPTLDALFGGYNFSKEKPFFIIALPIVIKTSRWQGSIKYTKSICNFLIWLQNNNIKKATILSKTFLSDDHEIILAGSNEEIYCVIDDKNNIDKLKNWLIENQDQIKEDNEQHLLWLTYDDFQKTLSDDGKVSISNSIKFEFEDAHKIIYKDNNYKMIYFINEEVFKIYKWMTNTLNGRVWYWSHTFWFELKEDVVAFKLYATGKKK